MIINGDSLEVLKTLDDQSVQCCITSPPYFSLRDYGVPGQIGLEETPEEYVSKITEVFREVRRVLKDDGVCFLNLGDSYSQTRWTAGNGQPMNKNKDTHRSLNAERKTGLPPKNKLGIPHKCVFALQQDGWIWRDEIIWAKPSCMPEPVTDRCTKSHEFIFMLAKNQKYYYDADAIKTPVKQDWGYRDRTNGKYEHGKGLDGRTKIRFGGNKYGDSDDPAHATKSGNYYQDVGTANRRSVWNINPARFADAHFATFPEELVRLCVLAGSKEGDTILDPFSGAGTTGVVALKHLREYIGVELNPDYVKMSEKRIAEATAQERIFV